MDQEVTGKAQSFLTRDDYHVYPPVLEDVRDWPIYKVSELRDTIRFACEDDL